MPATPDRNGRAAPTDVDPRMVIESLAQQVAHLTVELAVRDAALAGLRAELEQARVEVPAAGAPGTSSL